MRLIIFSIALVIIVGCHPYKVYKISGIDLNAVQADTAFRLRSDGLYNTVALEIDTFEQKFKTIIPLVILNNQKATLTDEANFNDVAFRLEYYVNTRLFTSYVGDYVIRNDTIWAKLPVLFYGTGMIPKIYESYFQGEIKNRDTIANWRMIRPFPKADRKLNDISFRNLTKPHQLYFIESKELLGLDSLYRQRLKEQDMKK
jgi:hypothetical protein